MLSVFVFGNILHAAECNWTILTRVLLNFFMTCKRQLIGCDVTMYNGFLKVPQILWISVHVPVCNCFFTCSHLICVLHVGVSLHCYTTN